MSLIPKKIYQSWKTKDLPEKFRDIVERTKNMNPEYEYELWDDNDCRGFLLDNFGKNYLNAFDVLIPGAFKCDFWRYAVLYVNGGVYMDMDMTPELPFREILTEKDELVSIVDINNKSQPKSAIYQAFIACRPRHPVMLTALQLSFANIISRRHELFESSLAITGPIVMGNALNLYWEKDKTCEKIFPGDYKDGIRLFKFDGEKIIDLSGKKIFNTKFPGYDVDKNIEYKRISSYYKDDPNKDVRKSGLFKYGLIVSLIVIVLCIIIFLSILKLKK
jgi:hypothetical protein